MPHSIPDWASVLGLIVTIGTILLSLCLWVSNQQSNNATQRFLVGLITKFDDDLAVKKAVNDELERLKPAKGKTIMLVIKLAAAFCAGLALGLGALIWKACGF